VSRHSRPVSEPHSTRFPSSPPWVRVSSGPPKDPDQGDHIPFCSSFPFPSLENQSLLQCLGFALLPYTIPAWGPRGLAGLCVRAACVWFFPPFKSFIFMNESGVEVAESPTHSALTHPPSGEPGSVSGGWRLGGWRARPRAALLLTGEGGRGGHLAGVLGGGAVTVQCRLLPYQEQLPLWDWTAWLRSHRPTSSPGPPTPCAFPTAHYSTPALQGPLRPKWGAVSSGLGSQCPSVHMHILPPSQTRLTSHLAAACLLRPAPLWRHCSLGSFSGLS
jgi:hypothetical protein